MNDERQALVSREAFEDALNYIEKHFVGNAAKSYRGQVIFVNLPEFNTQKTYVNTTISDLKDVCGDIKITWLEKGHQWIGGMLENPVVCSLRSAKRNEFRNVLRFTPPSTLAFMMTAIGNDGGVFAQKLPIKQDEKIVKDSNKGKEEIEANAIKFLEYNCPCSIDNKPPEKPHLIPLYSQEIQRMIELYFDLDNSWAIVYEWQGIEFVFPMEREYIKEVLKDRDKENGRRTIIPTIVHKHKRNGKEVESFIRNPSNDMPYVMNGRKFGVFIGSESYEQCLANTSTRERMKKYISENRKDLDLKRTNMEVK